MGWESFLAGFILPSLVSSAIGSYLFYAQHNFPDVTFGDKDGWTYLKAALESSSYMKMNPVMQWVTANIGLHHIHHVNSRIPFYRLPEVYQKMPEFQNARLTSLNISDIIQCFKLKVWDPEVQKMIGFKELYKK
jgi:omega-6 fatty acid desaturase (delta-12 desaturase)